MAGTVNLVFLLIVVSALVLATWALWSLAVLLITRRKAWTFLIGLPISILLVGAGISSYYYWGNRPETLFKREFGFDLPADTVVVESQSSGFGDSGSTSIHLRTSPSTFSRIVSAGYSAEPNPSRAANSSTQQYTRTAGHGSANPSDSNYSSERRTLKYDPSSGDVWYEFSGVD